MSHIFKKAINIAKQHPLKVYGPMPFRSYIQEQNLNVRGTAQHISVQAFNDLNAELRFERFMVFRLGSEKGQSVTSFALAPVIDGWSDYFFLDDDIFADIPKESFSIDWEDNRYIPFKLIPKLTETSHVNLALASNVLERALGFDLGKSSIPATGRGTYTFDVHPHSKLDLKWKHISGQVEVDSVLVGTREGEKHILVIEAKSGKYPSSLAKHKVTYPVQSIMPNIPSNYQVTPIYMRIEETRDFYTFYIAECSSYDSNDKIYINELNVSKAVIVEISKIT